MSDNKRKVKVTCKVVFEGEVSEGCDDAVITLMAAHLRSCPLSAKDEVSGDSLDLAYKGGGKFRVEFDLEEIKQKLKTA